ncbi:MAG TPA: thermonuclease family protein [Vitreimonas sp.]|nr:thermonuclease family protein [Vitreimonas sp.]
MIRFLFSRRLKSWMVFCIGVGLILGTIVVAWKESSTLPLVLPTFSPSRTVLGVKDEQGFETVQVKTVIDGDTIELNDGRKVRYIGIDTPETRHPAKGVECFGKEASAKNKELVAGKVIQLEKDVSESDRYGRLLRYVWLEGTLINKTLVEQGYAYASSYPPDVSRQPELKAAQDTAQKAAMGLWGSCETRNLEEINTVINQADERLTLPSNAAELSDGCVIKGNVSDRGQLYHLPQCPQYNLVKIDENKGERWFCSEVEATQSGWFKAGDC